MNLAQLIADTQATIGLSIQVVPVVEVLPH
jgi:hypothetical protein